MGHLEIWGTEIWGTEIWVTWKYGSLENESLGNMGHLEIWVT